jgi:hypothetical protein
MLAMERMSILFDCVRRLGPEEAGLVCQVSTFLISISDEIVLRTNFHIIIMYKMS